MSTVAKGSHTFTFRTIRLKTGDMATVKIRFIAVGTGANQVLNYGAEASGIFIEEFGKGTWSMDITRPAISIGTNTMKFIDLNGTLRAFLLQHTNIDRTSIRVQLELQGADLQYFRQDWPAEETPHTELAGYVVYDSIKASPFISERAVEFQVAPATDILNRQMLFHLDGTGIDPFNYKAALGDGAQEAVTNREIWIGLEQLITDCYKLVNPDVTVEFGGFDNVGFYGIWVRNFGAPELNERGTTYFWKLEVNVYRWLYEQAAGFTCVADILRELAYGLNAYTGMVTQDKAFFLRQLQVRTGVTELVRPEKCENAYTLPIVRFVRITQQTTAAYYLVPVLQQKHDYPVTATASAGTETGYTQDYIEGTSHVFIPGGGGTGTQMGLTNAIASASLRGKALVVDRYLQQVVEKTVTVVEILDEDVALGPWLDSNHPEYGRRPAYLTGADWIAKFWYKFRSTDNGSRVDKFTLPFLRYDYLGDFAWDGLQYRPTRMTKNYDEGYTEVEAIVVATAEDVVTVQAAPFNPVIQDDHTSSIGTKQFVGGLLGYGWRIAPDANGKYKLTIDSIEVRDTLAVSELLFQQKRTVNGSLIIGRTGTGKVTRTEKVA